MVKRFVSLLTLFSAALAAVFDFLIPCVPEPANGSEGRPPLSGYTVCDEIRGVKDSVFYVVRPKADALQTVYAANFGFSAANPDNYSAFAGIVDYCRQNPRTRVVFEQGDYAFRTDAGIALDGLQNIYFEGNGARFVFDYGRSYFNIIRCDTVEFHGITADWNWERSRLGSIVRVENADAGGHILDLVFTEIGDVSEETVFAAITQYDADTLTPGAKESSKEAYLYQAPGSIQKVEKKADNVLRVTHNGILDNFLNGEVYLLRHYVYGSAVFCLGGGSNNITFDGVNIFGAAGMGFVAGTGANHFQLLNTTVGLNPAYAAARRVSVTADAVHIADTKGYFRIENCDFGFMGDDAVNVHDNLGCIAEVPDADTVLVSGGMARSISPGDVIAFKNGRFETLSFTAPAISVSESGGGLFAIRFGESLPDTVKAGGLIYNTAFFSGNYVIRGCRFHENRARGLLLQSSNGLCENNDFYKIMGNAVKVVMDVSPGLWQEGTGVDSLVIRGNRFDMCSYSNWGAVVVIGTSLSGKPAKTALAFTNIEISGNSFRDSPSYILDANNVTGLDFCGNTISNEMAYSRNLNRGRLIFGFYCCRVLIKNNGWSESRYMFLPDVPKFSNPAMFEAPATTEI